MSELWRSHRDGQTAMGTAFLAVVPDRRDVRGHGRVRVVDDPSVMHLQTCFGLVLLLLVRGVTVR